MKRCPVRSVLLVASIAVLALAGQAPVAHAADPERIIVTNVRLVSRDAPKQDVQVNLLIVDDKLVVVTQDELAIQPGDTAVDSGGGFALGKLVLGDHPGFVIALSILLSISVDFWTSIICLLL